MLRKGFTLNWKTKVSYDRTSEFYGKFASRYNLDRNVKTIHANDTLITVLSMVGFPQKCAIMNVDEKNKNKSEILNVSFTLLLSWRCC